MKIYYEKSTLYIFITFIVAVTLMFTLLVLKEEGGMGGQKPQTAGEGET